MQSDPSWQAISRHQRGTIFRIHGQLARADQEERAEHDIRARSGSPTQAFTPVLDVATSELLLHDRAEAALRSVDSAAAKFPMSTTDPVDRPYLPLADFYVRAGQVEKAERLLAEYERMVPEALKNADVARPQSRALIALGKGQYAEAIKGFREYRDKNGGEGTSLPEIAQAFERMGQTDSAVATYEAYGPVKTKKGLRCHFDANPLVFACANQNAAWGLSSMKLDERSIDLDGKAADAHVYKIEAVRAPLGEPRVEQELRLPIASCKLDG